MSIGQETKGVSKISAGSVYQPGTIASRTFLGRPLRGETVVSAKRYGYRIMDTQKVEIIILQKKVGGGYRKVDTPEVRRAPWADDETLHIFRLCSHFVF